jgi:hypothetical protein
MTASKVGNATTDAGFFDGRIMIEIVAWDWNLYLGPSHPLTPRKYRFQGGLNYSRGIEIQGRVRAPARDRGKPIRVWISPFGPKVRFGKNGLSDVGTFYRGRLDASRGDIEASLMLPENALHSALTCLASVWKYLDIWVRSDEDEASISTFAFSGSIHPNLLDWAGPELEGA